MDRRRRDRRVTTFAVVVFLVIAVLLAQMAQLQIGEHSYFVQAANANAIRGLPLPAPRGLIVDDHGRVLAGDRPAFAATFFDYGKEPPPPEALELRHLVGIPIAEWRTAMQAIQADPSQPAVLRANLPPAVVTRVAENLAHLPGVSLLPLAARYYPLGSVASPIIGYATPGGSYAGLEAQYNRQLTGTPGEEEVEVNVAGQPVATLSTVPPKRGDTLVLSLDAGLQEIAYRALIAAIDQERRVFHQPARAGSLIVLDVHTGAVLALVSYPSYNPYLFVNGMSQAQYDALVNPPPNAAPALLNWATQVQLPPGSTFKMASAVAGLETHKITPQTEFYGYAVFPYPPYPHNWTYPVSTGWNDLVKAIAQSCDSYFYEVGRLTGITALMHWAAALGFGRPTGIDLPAEDAGLLPSRQYYIKQDGFFTPALDYSLAIGQGALEVTPIQLAQYTAALANDGVGFRPHLVSRIESPSGKVIWRYRPVRTIDVHLPAADWTAIHLGMHGTTSPASPYDTAAAAFAGFPLAVAGKTGTAQVPGFTSTYDTYFVSFAPLNDPQIAAVVFIDRGQEGANAAPAIRDVYDYYFHLKDPANPMPIAGLPGVAAPRTANAATGVRTNANANAATNARANATPNAATPNARPATPRAGANGNG
jgi:penicillin-binding protein 2